MAEHGSDWPRTRLSLMQRLVHGNEDAWSALLDVYGPLIYRFARGLGLREADCEDVTAVVVARVRGFRYEPAKGRFRDWLRVVTRNEARRVPRQNKRPGATGIGGDGFLDSATRVAAPSDAWDSLFVTAIQQAAIRRVRLEFNDQTWTAFFETVLKGREIARVAEELGWDVRRVYKARHAVSQRFQFEVKLLAGEAMDADVDTRAV